MQKLEQQQQKQNKTRLIRIKYSRYSFGALHLKAANVHEVYKTII